MNKIIFLEDIDLNLSPKTRSEISKETVVEYADSYKSKEKLPPPVLFEITGSKPTKYASVDGLHRINALKASGVKASTFTVIKGSREDMLRYAFSANLKHGLRRTNGDKRQCVETAVLEFKEKSVLELAEICHVSEALVREVRLEMEQLKKIESRETIVDRRGVEQKARVAKTSNSRPSEAENKGNNEEKDKPVPSGKTPVRAKNPAPETDETGYPIPEEPLVYWKRTPEVDKCLSLVSELKCIFKKAHDEEDQLWAESGTNNLLLDIDRIWTRVKLSRPFAVCPYCQGNNSKKCKNCLGKGIISKFKYDTGVDPKLKEIRAKSCKK